MLSKYISLYKADFDFEYSRTVSQEICGINVKIHIMEHNGCISDVKIYRVKAHVILEKGDFKYECFCVDHHNWDNIFHCVTLNGEKYLCFRKTLYGFTLLNINTLAEECDYFPATVFEGEESFIYTDVKVLNNLLIFDGCYWADSDACFAYDHSQKLFLNLSKEFTADSESQIEICGDNLVFTAPNRKSLTISHNDIQKLLNKKGTSDF